MLRSTTPQASNKLYNEALHIACHWPAQWIRTEELNENYIRNTVLSDRGIRKVNCGQHTDHSSYDVTLLFKQHTDHRSYDVTLLFKWHTDHSSYDVTLLFKQHIDHSSYDVTLLFKQHTDHSSYDVTLLFKQHTDHSSYDVLLLFKQHTDHSSYDVTLLFKQHTDHSSYDVMLLFQHLLQGLTKTLDVGCNFSNKKQTCLEVAICTATRRTGITMLKGTCNVSREPEIHIPIWLDSIMRSDIHKVMECGPCFTDRGTSITATNSLPSSLFRRRRLVSYVHLLTWPRSILYTAVFKKKKKKLPNSSTHIHDVTGRFWRFATFTTEMQKSVHAEIQSSSYVSYVYATTALIHFRRSATNFDKTWVSSNMRLSELHLRAVS